MKPIAQLRWSGVDLGVWVSTTRGGRELSMSELAEVSQRPLGCALSMPSNFRLASTNSMHSRYRAFLSKSDSTCDSSYLWVRLPGANGDTHSYNVCVQLPRTLTVDEHAISYSTSDPDWKLVVIDITDRSPHPRVW